MAFGDLTTKTRFTQSTDLGLSLLNSDKFKITLRQTPETVPMTDPIKEEPIGVLNKDKEGHINGLG